MFNMSNQCNDTDIVLSISYKGMKSPDGHHFPNWSPIYQPTFQISKHNKDFVLCEMSVIPTEILLNCSDLYINCNDGTCVHDSLVCDGQRHCPFGEDEADCQHICSDNNHNCMSHCHLQDLCICSPEYFQCLSGGCVPLQKLYDKVVHCHDESDEPPTCVYLRPEQIDQPSLSINVNSYINKLIQQSVAIQEKCFPHISETLVSLQKESYIMKLRHEDCLPTGNSSDVTFHCTFNPYMEQQKFSLDHLCIYDHDCDDDYSRHCFNGFHLLKCENMYCVGRFKCPSSYCISFDHICNNVCECPQCVDESICSKLLCPGMILIEQMESGLRCLRNVDEHMNMRQVVHRKGLNLTDDYPVFIHLDEVTNLTYHILTPELVIYCEILHSRIDNADIKILHHMVGVRRLLLPHHGIQKIYDSMFASMSQLIVLDLSYNFITYLPNVKLCSLYHLQYISVAHNLITALQISLFDNNPNVRVVMLESNNIDPQSVVIDSSLPSLYRFSSDITRLCCAFQTISFCSPPFPLQVSCSNMIKSKALIVLGWLIGLSTSCLSLLCLMLQIYKCFRSGIETSRIVMLFSINLSLAELINALCLLSYPVINVIFDNVFGIIADQWRHSLKCLSLESLFSMSSRASLAFAVCLSVHFAIHIPSIIHRKSRQKVTLFQIIITWLIIISTSIAVHILECIHNIDPFNYFCFPFTTSFPSDPLILGIQIILLVIDCLLVIVSVASHGYLLVFVIKRRMNKALQSVSKRTGKLQKLAVRLTVLIASTVLTWIPILCVQIIVLFQITILPTIYFWCILVSFPVNLIIDPILLIRTIIAR